MGKSRSTDNTIDTATFIALLQKLEFDQTEPEFFNYIWKKVSKKQTLTSSEFRALFDKPKNINVNDSEELTYLFQIFDSQKKGSFSQEDLLKYIKYSPVYQNKS